MKKQLVIVIAICILLIGCNSTRENNGSSLYKNEEYGISLTYPSHWKPNHSYAPPRYEGQEGYFQFSSIAGGQMDIDEVAELDAYHKLQPYGTSPKIEKLTIAGQEARLILPSEDQPIEMNKQAGLVIRYPRGVAINGEIYEFFELWADTEHIRTIGETLHFLN